MADITNTPREQSLKERLRVRNYEASLFQKRLRNIADNPEPAKNISAVVFTRKGKYTDAAVRNPVDRSWLLTGYAGSMDWPELIDNIASHSGEDFTFDFEMLTFIKFEN